MKGGEQSGPVMTQAGKYGEGNSSRDGSILTIRQAIVSSRAINPRKRKSIFIENIRLGIHNRSKNKFEIQNIKTCKFLMASDVISERYN